MLLKNKALDEAFSDEILLVIDDPISSFDFENKTGVYSFIHLMIDSIHNGNENSRIVVLTHEIEATRHLQKVLADNGMSGGRDNGISELKNQSIVQSRVGRNEYTELLKIIYHYASENADYGYYGDTIGNIMRRTLEAFGTFSYKTGIAELSTKPDILEIIGDPNKRDYFRCLMYRLLLHSTSHSQEGVEAMPETETLNYFSDEEKCRTAREILVFMNLLNTVHVQKHLSSCEGAVTTIAGWEETMFPAEVE